MKNFTDRFKCKNCNTEFNQEITSKNICLNNSGDRYINCRYCNSNVYLHKKIYKIRLTCEKYFSKIEAISEYCAVMKFIKEEEDKKSSFFNETTIVAFKNSIVIEE